MYIRIKLGISIAMDKQNMIFSGFYSLFFIEFVSKVLTSSNMIPTSFHFHDFHVHVLI